MLIGAATAQGGRDEMQDFYTVAKDNDLTFVGIFDGHGRKGELVAGFCAQELHKEVFERIKTCPVKNAIVDSLARMDERLTEKYGQNEETLIEIGGSTAVIALFQGNDSLVVAIVGDGRIILSKDGIAMDLCGEHKPDQPRERSRVRGAGGEIKDGRLCCARVCNISSRIEAAGGKVEDGRVLYDILSLDMSRSIGDFAFKMNPRLDAKRQMVITVPEIHTPRMLRQEDEFVVVTSDGIQGWESQEVVDFIRHKIVHESKSLDSICDDLLKEVDAPDNMSIVVVQLKQF